jgi:hypothetical protein
MGGVVVGLVAVALAIWLVGATGRRALGRLRERPHLLLAPLAVLVVEVVPRYLPPSIVVEPLYATDLAGIAFTVSFAFVVEIAVHVLALAWFLREAERVDIPLPRLAGSLLAILFLLWFATFAVLALVLAVAPGLGEAFWLVLGAFGLFQFWIASRTAPLLHALSRREGRLTGTWRDARHLHSAYPGKWRATALVHLLLLGALTLVHVERGGSYSTNLALHATSVISFSTENAWLNAIASALNLGIPDAVQVLVEVGTVLATTVFLAAYVVLGEEADGVEA